MKKKITGLLLAICIIAIGFPSNGQALNPTTTDTIVSVATPTYNMFTMTENYHARMNDTLRGYVISSQFRNMSFYTILTPTYDSVMGNGSLVRIFNGLTAGLRYIQRIWFDSVGQHGFNVDSVIILPQPLPPTIALTGTPTMNSTGLIMISCNYSTNVVATVRKYISYDSSHWSQSGSVKTVQAGSSGMLDTLGGALGSDSWIKVVITNPAANNTSYSQKIPTYVAPQAPWGKIDSIRQTPWNDTSNVTIYGQYGTYGLNMICRIAFGPNDTTSALAVPGSNGSGNFVIPLGNRITNHTYYPIGIFSNIVGVYTFNTYGPFVIPYTPTPKMTINNIIPAVTGLTGSIKFDYSIPSGTTNIYVDLSNINDSNTFSSSTMQTFSRSGSGTINISYPNLNSGTYYSRIQANYNGLPIIIKVPIVIPTVSINFTNLTATTIGGIVRVTGNFQIPNSAVIPLNVEVDTDSTFAIPKNDSILASCTGTGSFNVTFPIGKFAPGIVYTRIWGIIGGKVSESRTTFIIPASLISLTNINAVTLKGNVNVTGNFFIPNGAVVDLNLSWATDSNFTPTSLEGSQILANKTGSGNFAYSIPNLPPGIHWIQVVGTYFGQTTVVKTSVIMPSTPITITNAQVIVGPGSITLTFNRFIPNSAVVDLTIEYNTDSNNWSSLLDQKILANRSGSGNESVSFNMIPMGNYFVRIRGTYNTVMTWKVLPFTITAPAGINEVSGSANKMTVYPNPAINFLNVPSTGKYYITNVLSQIMMTGTIEDSQIPIGVSELPSGNYFIKIVNENGVQNAKFVK